MTRNKAYDKLGLSQRLVYLLWNQRKLVNVLDKEEFRIKLEEINKLVEKKDYKGAMNVVDSIDWRRVKNVRTLCVVGEIYAANKRYEDSREIFLLAYHRASIGKNILYRLIDVSLKMGDVNEATEFFEEFREVSPNDNTQYVLKYKIYKAKKAPIEEQIRILEEYKEREYTEKYAYELALLYYKSGQREKAIEACNEMILWFSEGSYVIKALDLKQRMGVLTGAEKAKYERQFIPKLLKPEDMEEAQESFDDKEEAKAEEKIYAKEEPVIESIRIRDDRDLSGAETLQDKISKGIRDIFGTKKKSETEEAEDEEAVQEEMIKSSTATEETFEDVPELEKEGEKPAAPLKQESDIREMKMPELKIPDSMKKIDLKDALKSPEMPDISSIMGSMEEVAASLEQEKKEDLDFDFNLEDTILAAASAQGIEIPDKPEEKPEEAVEKTAAAPIAEDEEDEILTEEDLQAAEAEFLNGPASVSKKDELEIPELEPENMPSEEIKAVREEEPEEEPEEPALEEEEEDLSEEEQLEKFIESITPKEEVDVLKVIPREHEMTEEEIKLFTYFVKVPGMKNQILDALCDVQNSCVDSTSRTGNIIVMGGQETGKTRLIASLIPAICKELNLEASKVAYVFADQINGKDIFEIVEKLAGGFLVIENANQLTQETADQLEKAMDFDTDGMIVIVEDEKIGMRKFIARFPKLAKKFTSIINIPVFTNDELVNFARVYTKENGYRIDQMGMLALYNQIGISQKEDQPMNIGTVKEILDNAIAKSQGGLFKRSKKRVDHDGFVVLHEKDFN